MKMIDRIAVASGIALLLFTGVSARADVTDTRADEAAIRAAYQSITDAYLKRDAVAAMAPYEKSNDLYLFDVMLPNYHLGYADSLKSTQDMIDGAVGPVHIDYGDVAVVVDHNHAYSHAIVHVFANMKNGKKTDFTDRTTDIWERRDGTWLIIHEHNSLALDPTRGKELVNATPRAEPAAR